MPIWLRKFTYSSLNEHYEQQAKANNKDSKTTKLAKGPDIQPTYSSKVSK